MKEFTCVINDELGIHARPAGMLAKEAKALGDTTVTIGQLMKVMGLGVKKGDSVKVSVEGGDEDAALEQMKKFFVDNFAAAI